MGVLREHLAGERYDMPEELFSAVDGVLEEEHRLQCRSSASARAIRATLLQRVRLTLQAWREGSLSAQGASLRLRALVNDTRRT